MLRTSVLLRRFARPIRRPANQSSPAAVVARSHWVPRSSLTLPAEFFSDREYSVQISTGHDQPNCDDPVRQAILSTRTECCASVSRLIQNFRSSQEELAGRRVGLPEPFRRMPLVQENSGVIVQELVMDPLLGPERDPLLRDALTWLKESETTHPDVKTLVLANVPGCGKTGATTRLALQRPAIILKCDYDEETDSLDGAIPASGSWKDRNFAILVKKLEACLSEDFGGSAMNYHVALGFCRLHILARLLFLEYVAECEPDPAYRCKLLTYLQLNGGCSEISKIEEQLFQFFGGAANFPDRAESLAPFLRSEISRICEAYDPIFIFDEVQQGENLLASCLPCESRQTNAEPSKDRTGIIHYVAVYALPRDDDGCRSVRVVLTGTYLRERELLNGYDGQADQTGRPSGPERIRRATTGFGILSKQDVRAILDDFFPDNLDVEGAKLSDAKKDKYSTLLAGRLRITTSFLRKTLEGLIFPTGPLRSESLASAASRSMARVFEAAVTAAAKRLRRYREPGAVARAVHDMLVAGYPFLAGAVSSDDVRLRCTFQKDWPAEFHPGDWGAAMWTPSPEPPITMTRVYAPVGEPLPSQAYAAALATQFDYHVSSSALVMERAHFVRSLVGPIKAAMLERATAVSLCLRLRARTLRNALASENELLGLLLRDNFNELLKEEGLASLWAALPEWYQVSSGLSQPTEISSWMTQDDVATRAKDSLFMKMQSPASLRCLFRPSASMGPDVIGIAPVDGKPEEFVFFSICCAYRANPDNARFAAQKTRVKVENYYLNAEFQISSDFFDARKEAMLHSALENQINMKKPAYWEEKLKGKEMDEATAKQVKLKCSSAITQLALRDEFYTWLEDSLCIGVVEIVLQHEPRMKFQAEVELMPPLDFRPNSASHSDLTQGKRHEVADRLPLVTGCSPSRLETVRNEPSPFVPASSNANHTNLCFHQAI